MQCLNVHPSLLPAYRGPAPIQRTLMARESETGVCVIQMGEVRRKEGKLVDQGGMWAVEKTVRLNSTDETRKLGKENLSDSNNFLNLSEFNCLLHFSEKACPDK